MCGGHVHAQRATSGIGPGLPPHYEARHPFFFAALRTPGWLAHWLPGDCPVSASSPSIEVLGF